MLPIILIPDVLGLSSSELQENRSSIFFLAFFGVVFSVAAAVGVSFSIGFFNELSFTYLMLLFIPLMATDLVSVGAIFSKFNLPAKLKLYAEGESLFNDITAMTLFFFIAIPLAYADAIEIASLVTLTLQSLLFSLFIGLFFGFFGYLLFKNARDSIEEFISVYLMASFAFLLAEELSYSGVLSVVVAVIAFKYLFNKEGHYKKRNYAAALLHLSTQKQDSTLSLRAYKKESHTLGFFANAVIFSAIATVVDLEILWTYSGEILYVFALTTLIRAVLLTAFARYHKHPLRWANVLTLAGMKGGLAIIMVISLSESFAHKEMFLAITLGVVILSIFINTLLLMLYLHFQKDQLVIDKAKEHHLLIREAKDIFQKEQESNAYNEIIFEDLVENEIQRANRYKQQFLLVAFKAEKSNAKKIEQKLLRQGDYFGKIDDSTYAILMPHTSLDMLFSFTQRLQKLIHHTTISIAEYTQNDTKELMYEKIISGFEHKNAIGIEV
jgi:CPA1 family monovalent cation:H+ antiporter